MCGTCPSRKDGLGAHGFRRQSRLLACSSGLDGLLGFQRFARADKRAKLPRWINQYITETASNLSTDMALTLSKLFMRTISQNPNENQTGVSLWTLEDVQKAQEKQRLAMAVDATAEEGDEFGDGGITDEMIRDLDLDV